MVIPNAALARFVWKALAAAIRPIEKSYDKKGAVMKKTPFLVLALIFALGLPLLAEAQADQPPAGSGILLRANLGYDPIGGGFAFGAGGGYHFPYGSNYVELLADVYYAPGNSTWTEGNYSNDYTSSLLILSVRCNWLFFYKPGSSGLYALAGVGVFAGSYSWKQVQTYLYSPYNTYTYSDQYFASGTILNLGAAFVLTKWLEARAEIPLMIFFGEYGRSAAVAIPITLSLGYRL